MPPTTIPRLPQELCDEIIDYYASASDVLFNLSAVSHSFAYRSQKHLHRSLSLRPGTEKPVYYVLDGWKPDPKVEASVRMAILLDTSLYIPCILNILNISCGDSLEHTKMFLSLPVFNLERLELSDLAFDYFDGKDIQTLPNFLMQNPRLKELVVNSAEIYHPRQLLPFPVPKEFLSCLSTLEVRKVLWGPDPEDMEGLEAVVDGLLSTYQVCPPHRPGLESILLRDVPGPLIKLLFLDCNAIFDLGQVGSDKRLKELAFLPLDGSVKPEYLELLNRVGPGLDHFETKFFDWRHLPEPIGAELWPRISRLTVGCWGEVDDPALLSWIAGAVSGTRLQHLVLHIHALYRPYHTDEVNLEAELEAQSADVHEDRLEAVDAPDLDGHGFIMNEAFDRNLSSLLDDIAAGTVRLGSSAAMPALEQTRVKEQFRISCVVKTVPGLEKWGEPKGSEKLLSPISLKVEQYLPKAATTAKSFGVQIDLSVVGEKSNLEERFE